MARKLLVVILGPTGSGKTAAAIELAKHFQTEIVSADSRQFYREIPIGTAAPDRSEQQGITHHFIGNLSITEAMDAGQWAKEVSKLFDELFIRNEVVILAGGSGLYIRALLEGMDELPEQSAVLRAELESEFSEFGIAALQKRLLELDPEFYNEVDRNNHKRLIRAIEVCMLSGKKYSELRTGKATALSYEVLKIGMEIPRDELYVGINKRVDRMIQRGLEKEARGVYQYRDHNALATVGYREMFSYFDGEISQEQAIELIKQHSRNYAKRQLTWWRRDEEITWVNAADYSFMIEIAERKLNSIR